LSLGLGGQLKPGPHQGKGILAVADWWLTIVAAVLGVTEAAATPATMIDKTKMRMTIFIFSNLSRVFTDKNKLFR